MDHTVLGSGKYQSEGVEDELMFVSGGDHEGYNRGKHKSIASNRLSQGQRKLGGGRKLSRHSHWFGPRDRDKEIKALEESKEKMKGHSYGPMIQKAGEYVTEEDLRGISEKGRNRDFGLETQILELYKPRGWWESKMGTVKGKEQVDLAMNLEVVKKILDTDEDSLKKMTGGFGVLVDNGKLKPVRLIGDPEAVAGNYLRRYAGRGDREVNKLREKKLVETVVKLMNGDEVGFPCVEYQGQRFAPESFKECKKDHWWDHYQFEVKSVLKTVVPNIQKGRIPIKDGRGGGDQQHLEREHGDKIYNSNFDESKVINEKCEEDSSWSGLTDWGLKISSGFKISGFKFRVMRI